LYVCMYVCMYVCAMYREVRVRDCMCVYICICMYWVDGNKCMYICM